MAPGIRDWDDRSFSVMGTHARVVLRGPDGLTAMAEARLRELERRWSRFLPDSEISRLNRAAGRRVRVAPDTFAVIARAIDAWRRTDGRFDPTGHDAIVRLGYDRDFAAMQPGSEAGDVTHPSLPLPGCADIELDRIVGAVRLPPGVALDLGGIGKGAAADLVVAELLAAGSMAVCVDLGGDVRVAGPGPVDGAWEVGFEDLGLAERYGRIRLRDGAVATSTTRKRRWSRGATTMHHLLDPATGGPAATGVDSVTVIAGEAWWAEVLAKAALVDGADAGHDRLRREGVEGVLCLNAPDVMATEGFCDWCSGSEQVLAGGEAAQVGQVQEGSHAVQHR